MDDKQTVEKVLEGNTAHFSLLVDKHHRQVFRVCMGFLHQREDAEDVAQETFVSAYKSLAGYEGNSSFSTWLYRIAVNQSLTFLRSKKRKGIVGLFDPFTSMALFNGHKTEEAPDKLMEAEQLRNTIQKAVDGLPENQRIAFTLSKYEELTQAQIAEVMMLSEGAVESLLQRAKKNLQKSLHPLQKK